MRRTATASALALAAVAALCAGGGADAAQTTTTSTSTSTTAPASSKVPSATPYMGWDVYLAGLGGGDHDRFLRYSVCHDPSI